ncbi:MAG: organic solvent tolerance protein OstA [Planctomycetia bacterium]|nr:organic solvent tolerance protein OstA [Planctomycetia bacterium]
MRSLVLAGDAFSRRATWAARAVMGLFCALYVSVATGAEIELPRSQPWDSVYFAAPNGYRWQQGAYEVWWLTGGVDVKQGGVHGHAKEAVLWIKREGDFTNRHALAIAYLEGNVDFTYQNGGQPARVTDQSWLGEFSSTALMHVETPNIGSEPREKPAIFARGMARREPRLLAANGAKQEGWIASGAPQAIEPPANAPTNVIQRTEFVVGETPQAVTVQQLGLPSPGAGIPPGMRRVRVYPRNTAAPQAQFVTNPDGTETVGIITGGINFIIDGVVATGAVDIYTDNLVVWTQGIQESSLAGGEEAIQPETAPLELYLEGNIVFKQGDRTIYADRMYFDVRNNVGVVLNAEMLTPSVSPAEAAQFAGVETQGLQFNGILRLKADVLQQLGANRFHATNAWLSGSRMGRPAYRLQGSSVYFQDVETPVVNPVTGQQEINPQTQEPLYVHERLATSHHNVLYMRDVPVLYWPKIATDLEKPTYYINSLQFKTDRIFGNQVLSEFDVYQILGIENPPPGTKWNVSADWLSERGFGHGTEFRYEGPRLLGYGGPHFGFFDYWGIDDHDTDNLGSDRPAITTGKDYRYRLLGHHRQMLPWDLQFTGELGWISDRNFLEEYYENEWDELKDETTGFELKKLWVNQSFNLTASTRINDFFTETEQLPRADHFLLGQSLFGNLLTWHAHTQASLSKFRVTNTPEDPVDRAKFGFLPWEQTADGGTSAGGEKIVTRQEIDLPLQAGGFKFVPYALGELGHWGEDVDLEDTQRAYGQVGVRASIPFWTVDPTVESGLLNLHGMSHKVVFDGEFAYSDTNRDLDDLPLYEQLDDNSIEHFRRRFAFNTFGGPAPVPARFEERFYAVRTGLGSWVTSPSTETVDDLMAVRFGVKQRWQTKRGLPTNRRIIDWIVLDTNATWFPKNDKDNFGEPIGLVDYNFRWHVGDRFTLLSDGIFDFFLDGQQIATIGGFLNRPPKGGLYVGFHSLEGPINSQVVMASYSYRMSPKWVSAISTAVDVGGNGSIGQNVQLTRVGESFLMTMGLNVDHNRDNVGFSFMVEPRFLPGGSTLGRAGGATVPLAGLYGLE